MRLFSASDLPMQLTGICYKYQVFVRVNEESSYESPVSGLEEMF